MESAFVKLIESAPSAAALLLCMWMMLKYFEKQKNECHEWQQNLQEDNKVVINKIDTTLTKTNECLTQCAMGHARSERVYAKLLRHVGDDDGSDEKIPVR